MENINIPYGHNQQVKGENMFTLDGKEFDESKLEGKSKIAFNNVKQLTEKRNELAVELERIQVLIGHYSTIVKDNIPIWLRKLK
jgi:hypothetical protein